VVRRARWYGAIQSARMRADSVSAAGCSVGISNVVDDPVSSPRQPDPLAPPIRGIGTQPYQARTSHRLAGPGNTRVREPILRTELAHGGSIAPNGNGEQDRIRVDRKTIRISAVSVPEGKRYVQQSTQIIDGCIERRPSHFRAKINRDSSRRKWIARAAHTCPGRSGPNRDRPIRTGMPRPSQPFEPGPGPPQPPPEKPVRRRAPGRPGLPRSP